MRTPYILLVILTGLASAFLIYLGATALDLSLVILTLIYWIAGLFMMPLPKPLSRVYNVIALVFLAVFIYVVVMKIITLI